MLTTIKNNIMLLAEYVSGLIFTHTATEVSTGKILVSFMGLGISVLLIVMALMVWVLRARPQKGKPPRRRKTAKKKAARKAARKAAKKKAAKKWPRLFGKKKPPKPVAKSESKPEAESKPEPDAKPVMKDAAADTTDEVADSQGEAAKDEAPESTAGATPESTDDADSAATLAAIESEMIALKELYNTGHITAQVYVAESRALYEKARQCAPPPHG